MAITGPVARVINRPSMLTTPPLRCWEATGNLNEYGQRTFSSRDWKQGEAAQYIERLNNNGKA